MARMQPEVQGLLPKETPPAFKTRSDLDGKSPEEIREVFDGYSQPKIFSGRVCGFSPALLLWLVNALCFVIHAGMGVAVLVQGSKGGDALSIQTKTMVAIWQNRTAEGYTFEVKNADLVLRLDFLCATFAFLSALAHLVICCFSLYSIGPAHARFNLKYYYFGLHQCLIPWRWVEYSLSAPVMAVAICLTAGIRDVNLLAAGFFLQMSTILFGWLTEVLAKPNHGGKQWAGVPLLSRLLPYFFGWVPYICAWTIFVAQFFRNVKAAEDSNPDGQRMPDFVYVIVLSEVAVFSLFAIPLPLFQGQDPKKYYQSEVWYSFLSLTSKTLLNGLLLANVFVFSS